MPKRMLIGNSGRRRGFGVLQQALTHVKEVERMPQSIEGLPESRSTIIVKINGKRYRISATRL